MSNSSNSCFIITGMHRSNTSFLAKSFMDAGLHIGDDLIPPDQFNQEGHFEDQDFVSFHDRLIANYKLKSWYSVIDYKKCHSLKIQSEDLETAKNMIQSRWTNRALFGWKDPRTCHFLPFWKELVPQAKFIFIVREPEASVSSLLRRYQKNKGDSFRPDLWYRYHRFWQVANQQIIDFHVRHSHDSHILFTPEDITDQESTLINDKLNDWQIVLDKIKLVEGYRTELISSKDASSRINETSMKIYDRLWKIKRSD